MGQPDIINYFSEPEIIRVIPSWLHKVKGFTAQKNFKILKPDQEEKLKILEQFGTMAVRRSLIKPSQGYLFSYKQENHPKCVLSDVQGVLFVKALMGLSQIDMHRNQRTNPNKLIFIMLKIYKDVCIRTNMFLISNIYLSFMFFFDQNY